MHKTFAKAKKKHNWNVLSIVWSWIGLVAMALTVIVKSYTYTSMYEITQFGVSYGMILYMYIYVWLRNPNDAVRSTNSNLPFSLLWNPWNSFYSNTGAFEHCIWM